MLAAYIQYKYDFKNINSPANPKGAQKPFDLHSSPMCWHDISNTNIYIQLTFIPQIVGRIYPTQIYNFKNVHSPTLRPKGEQKLPNNTFIPLVLAWYIQYQYISTTDMYSSIKSEYKYKYY